jgi:hypothetical protein
VTALPEATTANLTYRSAGRAAITSGVFGIMALGFLIVGVASMVKSIPDSSEFANLMFRTHHVGVILQSLFMIPVAFGLHMIATQRLPRVGKTTLAVGVASLSSIVLCALLFLVNVVADDLYTVPQGVLGVWLMVVNRRMSSVLPRGLTRFGTVVGFGLLLVGTFPLAYGIFVDPIGLHGPIPPNYPNPDTTANAIIHDVFYVGTVLGVWTYPIWTILLGRRLLRAQGL